MARVVAIDTDTIPKPPGSEPVDQPPPPVEIVEAKVLAELDDSGEHDDTVWYLDSGATNHMCGERSAFSNLDSNIKGTVSFGDGSVAKIEGRGTILFASKDGSHRPLTGVYFIPRLTNNIISLGQLDEAGCDICICHGLLKIHDDNRRLLVKVPRTSSRLYILKLQLATPVCLAAHHDDTAWLWHERYDHLHFDALRKLARDGMVRGLPQLDRVHQLCDNCIATKQRRKPFPTQAKGRAEGLIDLVHDDLCGPISPMTPSGKQYFLLLVDDCSRYMWLHLLAAKNDAAATIQSYKALVETETGRRLRVLRTDHGGEFTSVEFAVYCAGEGVQRQHSAPYSSQQNGVVERRNQTIIAMARSLLRAHAMPAMFWGETVMTAVHLLNHAPTKALSGKTPFEVYYGRKPAVHYLRTFGCVAHVKTVRPHQKKLDDRSAPMVFIGYEPGAKAYWVYDTVTRRVQVSRDIIFDENRPWDWSATMVDAAARTSDFIMECSIMEEHVVGQEPAAPPSTSPAAGATPAFAPAPASVIEHSPGGHVSPPPNDSDNLDADHDEDVPLRYRTMDDILGLAIPRGPAPRNLVQGVLMLQIGEEPDTFTEAHEEQAWRDAMAEEIKAIDDNNTWRLVTLPLGYRPIGFKWVFKVKKGPNGEIVKHKARLVAKGYVQQPGRDFDEVFAPVARIVCSLLSPRRKGGESTTWT
jgi:transposase InsO family protein